MNDLRKSDCLSDDYLRGWNEAWLAAIAFVAEARNALPPGPDFRRLNELMGDMDSARRVALRALAKPEASA